MQVNVQKNDGQNDEKLHSVIELKKTRDSSTCWHLRSFGIENKNRLYHGTFDSFLLTSHYDTKNVYKRFILCAFTYMNSCKIGRIEVNKSHRKALFTAH